MSKPSGYDLHTHTNFSDGTLSPRDLIVLAKSKGLEGIAISDHDTIEGAKQASMLTQEHGIEVVPCVELGCMHEIPGRMIYVEIMGYYIDPFNKDLEKACQIDREFRKPWSEKVVFNINKMYGSNIKIADIEAIAGTDSIGMPHIARVMKEKGLVATVQEAFDKSLDPESSEKNCYVEKEAITLEHGLDSIWRAGGTVGLAHPGLISKKYSITLGLTDALVREYFREYFRDKAIPIIEVNYLYFNPRVKRSKLGITEEESRIKVAFWDEVADKEGLIKANGSDGHQKPGGPEVGEKVTRKEVVELIRALAEEQKRKSAK